jgi:hypothetical protein
MRAVACPVHRDLCSRIHSATIISLGRSTNNAGSKSPSALFDFWAVGGWVLAFILGAVLIFRFAVGGDVPRSGQLPTNTTSESSESSTSSVPPAPSEPGEAREPIDPLERTRQAMFVAYVEEATELIQEANYEAAIECYDKALEIEPGNVNVLQLRAQAAMLKAQETGSLEIRQSRTEVVGVVRKPQESGGIAVSRATDENESFGELIVEIRPMNPKPGDPFLVSVRLHNAQNRSIRVKTLELVSTFGSKSIGRGQQLTPLVSVAPPKTVSLLYETRGTWTEDRAKGSIEAIVTTVGDTALRKKIWW